MKKLYILITNNISFDQRMQKIAETLSKDYNVTIIGSSTRRPPPLAQRPFLQKRLWTFFQSGKGFYLEFNLRLLWMLFWRKPDIIYSVDLDTLLPASIISKVKGKPLIYDAHEYFTEVPELQGRTFVQKLWLRIERVGVKQASLCITVGAELSKIYESLHEKTFHVIRNVPILKNNKEKGASGANSKLILYQGAVNEGRGVEASIRAMKYLPHFQLVIAGGGPLLESCKDLVETLGVSNVIFTGMLSPDQLRQYTRKAWLGLNLLEGESLNYYYSLANKFFDYTSCLVPSLNMDFPEYRTLINQHNVGLLLKPENLNELHEYVLSLEKNQQLYDLMQKACLEARKEWNWSIESSVLSGLVKQHT